MLWVTHGQLKYGGALGSIREPEQDMDPGDWAVEWVLWTEWEYLGTLRAVSDCKLMMLNGRSLKDVARNCPTSDFELKTYAAEYVKELNSSSTEISDLGFCIDSEKLV